MNTEGKNSIVWFNGEWNDGSKPIMSSMSQSYMHGSTIFDGARAYKNTIPDLHKHCERLINSSNVGWVFSIETYTVFDAPANI